MKHSIEFLGQRTETDWSHFAWRVLINGQAFEYKTGMGHATSKANPRNNCFYNRKPKDRECVSSDTHWVHVPAIDDILECLFSDVDAGSVSFNDFCADFGYNSDSLKALDTYRACMDTATRLRSALGAEYQTEKQRIERRNA